MYHILLVDDQMDARQMLRASLETLGPAVHVTDVPSGEEALLVYTRQTVDLVVIDMRLAGMNGIELMDKLRKRRPDLRVVMVTGVTDERVRTQVSQSAADAVFFKPVVLADFLDTVERLLGMVAGAAPVAGAQPALGQDKPSLDLSQTLATLRQQLAALSVVLLDHGGRVLARAGELPDKRLENHLLPSLSALLDASQQVALRLASPVPQDSLRVAGENFEVHCAHIGSSAALVVLTSRLEDVEARLVVARRMYSAVGSLAAYLPFVGLGGQSQAGLEEMPLAAHVEEPQDEGGGEVDPELKDLIEQTRPGELKPEEVESFWQELSGDEQPGRGLNAGAISYDQARHLGLLPGDEED